MCRCLVQITSGRQYPLAAFRHRINTLLKGQYQRLLLLVLLAALPVFLLNAWSEIEERRERRLAAEDQLVRSVRLLAAQQDQFFQRAESILTAMLTTISESWQDTAACNARLARLAVQNPAYTGFGITDPKGTIVCTSLPERRAASMKIACLSCSARNLSASPWSIRIGRG